MTFDEWAGFKAWQATAKRTTDFEWAAQAFGDVGAWPLDGDAVEVVEHEPGIIVLLKDGTYYTQFDRDEVRGTLEEVQRALWDGYAKFEVDDASDEGGEA
jgi:hypothetical protein